MDWSTPDFPVLYLPVFAQTHVPWVGDAMQPSHPLLPLSLSALHLSQHQGLFQWISSSNQVAKLLDLQHQYFPVGVLGWFPLRSRMFGVLIRRRFGCRQMQRRKPREDKAGTGAMLPQAKGHLGPPELNESRKDLPRRLWREWSPTDI